jgi:UDPglucose 6-dehydrogenase
MKILVVGLGKLGLPLAAVLADAGHSVLGYDRSTELVHFLESKSFYSSEPNLMHLLDNALDLSYSSSINLDMIEKIALIFIIVPTPSLNDGSFSNEFILETFSEIGPLLKLKQKKTAICIVSTVMPGSCDGDLRTGLESAVGETLGKKIGLCYHPEFIALGSVIKNLQSPDFHLLGAADSWVSDLVEPVFKSMTKFNVPCKKMSFLEAEIVKISVNNYITMKISFANSLLQLCDNYDNVNIHAVTQAIGMDSRIGTKYLTAGPPYGGPCFPRDTRAMSKLFKDFSISNAYPDLTSRINAGYTDFLVNKVLNLISKKDVLGILGVSYKAGTPIIDESPGVSLTVSLLKMGMKVYTWDDENAKVPYGSNIDLDLSQILESCDFFILTRNTKEIEKIHDYLKLNNKKFIDLWNL